MDQRLEQLTGWVASELKISNAEVTPASSDASFRRYFRVRHDDESFIVMDAPPEKEDCGPFIRISAAMSQFGLNVPKVLQRDLDQGFLLLTDLGEQQYLQVLNSDNADRLYGDAIDALIKLQVNGASSTTNLPCYDHKLLTFEMSLFTDWLLQKQLRLSLSHAVKKELDTIFQKLAEEALSQSCVWVHRDYHSRNLMLTDANNPGVLDFQDAVLGPLTYDLVSLLKDCYISWPRDQVEGWVAEYYDRIHDAGLAKGVSQEQTLRWFDLMGAQRHLKAAGIFARLNIRDGKPGYLADIPRTLNYICEAAAWLPELRPLKQMVCDEVLPALE